jgi:hypothetical protein
MATAPAGLRSVLNFRFDAASEKEAIELQKLKLEQKVLERQLSWHGVFLDWLKAAAVPVTLIGAALAFYVGFSQLNQTEQNKTIERFDKGLERLAGERADVRMTGVSGLALFLRNPEDPLQKQSLEYLVNSLSIEGDSRIQSALLATLESIPAGILSQESLDNALKTAVARNRDLTLSLLADRQFNLNKEKQRLINELAIVGPVLKVDGDAFVPAKAIEDLETKSYLRLLDLERGPFEIRHDKNMFTLRGVARAIEKLVQLGARGVDFKEIFCEYCDLSSAGNIDGGDFTGAFLSGANFSSVSLRRASFFNADIGGTIFFGSDLTEANLTSPSSLNLVSHEPAQVVPILECANLEGADLTGQRLLVVDHEYSTVGSAEFRIFATRLTNAKVNSYTKMADIGIVAAEGVTDFYVMSHIGSREVEFLTKSRTQFLEIPFLDGAFSFPVYRRMHAEEYAVDADKWTRTRYYANSRVTDRSVDRLTPEAKVMRGFISEPALSLIPIVAKFNARLELLAKAGGSPGDPIWKLADPVSCDKAPDAGTELVLSGTVRH